MQLCCRAALCHSLSETRTETSCEIRWRVSVPDTAGAFGAPPALFVRRATLQRSTSDARGALA